LHGFLLKNNKENYNLTYKGDVKLWKRN